MKKYIISSLIIALACSILGCQSLDKQQAKQQDKPVVVNNINVDTSLSAFHKGDVVYAEIHGNKLCELAVVIRLPLSPDKAAEANATYEDDVYMVYTSDGEHSRLRPNELYPIVIPLTDSKKLLFSLVSKVADNCASESKLEKRGYL